MGKNLRHYLQLLYLSQSDEQLPPFGLLQYFWSQFNWFEYGTVCPAKANNAWGTQDSLLCLLVVQRVLHSCSVAFLFHAGSSS